mgnify:CR=1 FL=1
MEKTKANDPMQYHRAFDGMPDGGCIRMASVNAEKHTAEFIIASDSPVRDWYLPTSLRMTGVSLERYNRNPVVLAQHEHGVLAVVGRSLKVWTEGPLLIALAEFDTGDEFANRCWGKISRGFCRTASVGFSVIEKRDIDVGRTDEETKLTGPVRIATRWEPYEWSIVAVPADEKCTGRSLNEKSQHEGTVRFPRLKNRFS